MKRVFKLASLVCAVLALSVSGTAYAQSKDKVVLMLNWYLYSEHAPFFLGKERGYYDQEGIDLDIQEGRGSGVTVQAVAANTATFGYVDIATMIKAAAKGAPVKAVGVALQLSPMSVMGFADKNIKTPKDIVGKTVAVTPGDSMSQIWPLFLKKTDLKETDFKTVAGDAQTKLNAVMNGQADLLLGYAMDQSMKIKDATGKDVFPIKFADYGVNLVSSGVIVNKDWLNDNKDLVKRFMTAATKSLEEASKHPKDAAQAILNANPKGGKIETLTQGFELTIPLYKDPSGKKNRPFNVTDANVKDTVDVMVEYGGLDAKAKEDFKNYYTNAYLPAGSGS